MIKAYPDIPKLWDVSFAGNDRLAFIRYEDWTSALLDLTSGATTELGTYGETTIYWDTPGDRLLTAERLVADDKYWTALDATGTQLLRVACDSSSLDLLALSADGRKLALSPEHKHLTVCDAHTGDVLFEDDKTDGSGGSVFSPDGRILYTACAGKPLCSYDTRDGTRQQFRKLRFSGFPRRLVIAPNGRWLIDGSANKRKAFVIDTETMAHVAELQASKPFRSCVFTSDSRRLLVAHGSSLRIIDTATWATERETKVHADKLSLSPDGRRLAAYTGPGVGIHDLAEVLAEPNVPAKPAKKSKAAKPKTHGVFFAADPSATIDEIRKAADNLYHILDDQPDDFVLLVEPGEVAGVRWFTFVGSRGRRYVLGPWIHSLAVDLGDLVVALHDDTGFYSIFERYANGSLTPSERFFSKRALVSTTAGAITVDYPQKGISLSELVAAADKRAAQRTPAEKQALRNYHTAVQIGLRQCVPAAQPLDRYTALRTTGQAHHIAGKADPSRLYNCVDLIPAYDTWPDDLAAALACADSGV